MWMGLAVSVLAVAAIAGDGRPASAQRADDPALEGRKRACRQAFLAHGIASCPFSSQNCSSDCANAPTISGTGAYRLFAACVYQCYVGCGFQDPAPTGNPCDIE